MYETRAELFRALGDPTRLRILALLRVRQACVCELVELLPMSQPAVSQHLRKLKQVGLVSERRQKYWTYYALRDDVSPAVRELVRDLPQVPDQEEWLSAHRVDTVCQPLPNPDASRLITISGG
ncbi:MAG: metalloregulator ArsR/SmtB family transcription factor [Firmicutes bacterium]|nr:metalloregulator ArsR/SmtB family transcription factor [Bacillota bacterium]